MVRVGDLNMDNPDLSTQLGLLNDFFLGDHRDTPLGFAKIISKGTSIRKEALPLEFSKN